MAKKGAGHIEVILSFVMFFLFVGFLLVFIQPPEAVNLSGSVISSLHDTFKEENIVNLSRFSIKTTEPLSGYPDCFFINVDGQYFVYDLEGRNSLVKDASGNILDSSFEGSGNVGKINLVEVDGDFYRVYLAEGFEDAGLSSCEEYTDLYSFGSILERKIISSQSLSEMKVLYENDYESLKKELRIPEVFDFAIVSPLVKMERTVPENAEVNAKDYLEEVLMEDGTIKNVRFTLKVW